jgi:hypothetical protein
MKKISQTCERTRKSGKFEDYDFLPLSPPSYRGSYSYSACDNAAFSHATSVKY